MTRNRFKVPKKQWRKWNSTAREVFNAVYKSIKTGYCTLFPKQFELLPKSAIAVMAWNSAWIAADAANI